MTINYKREGKTCANCGSEVKMHWGHRDASEATYCDECYNDEDVDVTVFADVIHSVPKVEGETEA